ncbi:MAG: hypothetical protein IEMM0008_0266 [bacterium]|nr:MAG: hypothetical protein IEMM0008_0266 [bacterium]
MTRYWFFIIILAAYFPQTACQKESKDTKVKQSNTSKQNNKSNSLTASLDTTHPDEITQSEEDKSDPKTTDDIDDDSFLDSINEDMLKETEEKSGSIEDEKGNAEDEEHPDDGSWVLMIDDKKISRQAFEKEYQEFRRLSPIKLSKKKYINVYLQNHVFKNKAQKYFADKSINKLLKLVRRKAMIDYYLSEQIHGKKIQTPSIGKLKAFYSQLIRQKGFGHLKLGRHRGKIKQLYRQQELNKRTFLLDQSLKGRYKIISNDEWEEDVISKYINNRYNKKKALGKNYKRYWLYKILIGKDDQKDKSKKSPSAKNKIKIKIASKIKKSNKLSTPDHKEIVIKKVKKDKSKASQIVVDSVIHDTMTSIGDGEKIPSKPGLQIDRNTLSKDFDGFQKNNNFRALKKSKNDTSNPFDDSMELGDETPPEKLNPLFTKGQYKYRRSIQLYIKDVESTIQFYRQAQLNPKLIRVLRKNPQARQQFVNRILLEELVYRQLKEKKLLYSQKYKGIGDLAVRNFSLNYYMKNVLGLNNRSEQKRYLMKYMESHRIKLSERYFDQ